MYVRRCNSTVTPARVMSFINERDTLTLTASSRVHAGTWRSNVSARWWAFRELQFPGEERRLRRLSVIYRRRIASAVACYTLLFCFLSLFLFFFFFLPFFLSFFSQPLFIREVEGRVMQFSIPGRWI